MEPFLAFTVVLGLVALITISPYLFRVFTTVLLMKIVLHVYDIDMDRKSATETKTEVHVDNSFNTIK